MIQKFRKVHCAVVQIVEITEIYSHREKFRQINDLVISLVKTLLSRYFCPKRVRGNIRNFHTVLWKLQKITLTEKKLSNQLFSISLVKNVDFTTFLP